MRMLLMAGVIGCAFGCNGGSSNEVEETPGQRALTELAGVLPLLPKPATKLADLDPYRESASLAYESVKSGEVVVVWGVTMPGEGDAGKGTNDIVAYEKNAPTSGGFVLLHNGTVKKLSAAEFQSTPKAK